jgi:hypothetical protein
VGFLEKLKKTIWSTEEKEFVGLLKEGFVSSLTYFIILLVFGSVANFALAFVATRDVFISLIAMALGTFTYALGIGFFLPVISHFLIGLFGGKRPMADTFQVYFYASTPSLLLAWVPCVGELTPLVSFGNAFRGLREINKLGFWQAAVAVLLPSLIYWGAWIVFIVGISNLAG